MKQEILEKECTFKPQINRVTKKIARSKRLGSNSSKHSNNGSQTNKEVFNKLYEDSKEDKKKISTVAHSILKSSTNNSSKQMFNSSRSTKLKDFKSKRLVYMKKQQNIRNEHCKTSLIATRPSRKSIGANVNKSKSGTRSRSNGKSVHEDLYIDSKVRHQRVIDDKCRQIYKERKNKLQSYLNKKPTNYTERHRSKSRIIMQKIKVQRCKDLFEILDSDQDGRISSQKIDILGVSNEIIDIITPLLLKIEQKALILNYSDFYELLSSFSKNLKTELRKVLFGPIKQIKSKDVLNTFRPRLNSKSMHI